MNPSPRPAAPCLHCRVREGVRCRGLCSTCYYRPSIRNLYPKRFGSYFAEPGAYTLPTSASQHQPGSPEKIKVLAERFAERTGLWHPDDIQ